MKPATPIQWGFYSPIRSKGGLPQGVRCESVVDREHGSPRMSFPTGERRAGWAEAALALARAEPGLLEPPTATRFDEKEWSW